MKVVLRRAAATLALLLGTALLLGLVFDSGLLGDPALRELGPRATPGALGEARERLGVLRDFRSDALRVDVPAGGARLRLETDGSALRVVEERFDRETGSAERERARLSLEGDLAALAKALNALRGADGAPLLVAEPAAESGSLVASGLLPPLRGTVLVVEPGRAPIALGWGERVRPLPRTLARIGALLRLDFGLDRDGRPVAEGLRARGLRSLAVAVPAFLLSTLLALTLALVAAMLGGRVDRVLTAAAAIGIAVPALAWILFLRGGLAFGLGWFEVRPWSDPVLPLLVLPVLCWVAVATWPDLRLYRAMAAEHGHADWMRAARAAGVSRRRLLWRYLLPAVTAPVLARVAVTLPYLFTGSLLLERIFDIPGLGDAVVRGVEARDENLLRATTFLSAAGFLLAQWLADALAAWCDPRLRRAPTHRSRVPETTR